MKITNQTTMLSSPITISFFIICFIIFNFLHYFIIVLLISLFFMLLVVAYTYQKLLTKKIDWKFVNYTTSSSIDELIECSLIIKNRSFLPIYSASIQIEYENGKNMVFLHKQQVESAAFSYRFTLPANGEVMIPLVVKGESRGHFNWEHLDIVISDPLLLTKNRIQYSPEFLPHFIVLPRIIKVNELKIASILYGNRAVKNSYFQDETKIIGTKYYENETIRHINWRATAKENKIMANKYEKINGSKYSIFLNIISAPQFSIRSDMEDLIEYTLSLFNYLTKEGCELELFINYGTAHDNLLKLTNKSGRMTIRQVIHSLNLINTKGIFLSTPSFFSYGFQLKEPNSIALIVGTPPEKSSRHHFLHLK